MNKIVIILRGVPGCGKSTIAKYISSIGIYGGKTTTICTADDYFIDANGEYVYIANEIHNAHLWCQKLFQSAIDNADDLIIVANTSTRESDVKYYRDIALEYDYNVFVMTVENWHNGIDVHNVPIVVKDKMKNQLKNSIKL